MLGESMRPSNHLILCHPLLLPPSIFPSIRVFPMSQLFTSGGQSIGASVSASGLPMNIQGWLPLGLTGLISLKSKGLSRVFSSTTIWKHQFSAFFIVQLSHPYMTTRKTIALTRWTFVGKVMSLLFNMLFGFVIAFLPRSNCLLISWLRLLSAVILEYVLLYLEKAMATHSCTLAWKIPWMKEPDRLQSMGSRRVRHDWATSLSLFTFMHWRRKWQLTPVFLPGDSQGRQSLVGCHLWGRTELDTTEAT